VGANPRAAKLDVDPATDAIANTAANTSFMIEFLLFISPSSHQMVAKAEIESADAYQCMAGAIYVV
jgi:hypothetical protein